MALMMMEKQQSSNREELRAKEKHKKQGLEIFFGKSRCFAIVDQLLNISLSLFHALRFSKDVAKSKVKVK